MLKFALAAAATAVTLDGLNQEPEDALVEEEPQELDLADQLIEEEDTDDQDLAELELDEGDDEEEEVRPSSRRKWKWAFPRSGVAKVRSLLRKKVFSTRRFIAGLKRQVKANMFRAAKAALGITWNRVRKVILK